MFKLNNERCSAPRLKAARRLPISEKLLLVGILFVTVVSEEADRAEMAFNAVLVPGEFGSALLS